MHSQLNLFTGKELCNKKRNIQLQIDREEQDYIGLMKAVHRLEKDKAVLQVEMITGIDAASQRDMPKHKNTYNKLQEQLNQQIKDKKAEQKKLRKSFNVAEKELIKLTKKEVSLHKMRLGLSRKSLNQQLAMLKSSVKGNKYKPSETTTMDDNKHRNKTYNKLISLLEEYDKSLGVLFSEFKRNAQLCQEQKKRLKEQSSEPMCWDIPWDFVTVQEKIDFLDFKSERFIESKERIKRQRAALDEFSKMLHICKENVIL